MFFFKEGSCVKFLFLMAKRILIIDDIKSVLEEVYEILTMEGFEVVKTTNGYEATGYLEENNIDLVVTDLMMKDLNGFEVISFPGENN